MTEGSDPRVFFAAERTLLAWLRSGLTVIGLGFVVARFGLFLHLLRRSATEPASTLPSSLIGIGLVVVGALMIATAAWQHTRFIRHLSEEQRPRRYWLTFGVWVCVALSLLGFALAVYLMASIDARTSRRVVPHDQVVLQPQELAESADSDAQSLAPVERGRPFGGAEWTERTAKRLGWRAAFDPDPLRKAESRMSAFPLCLSERPLALPTPARSTIPGDDFSGPPDRRQGSFRGTHTATNS